MKYLHSYSDSNIGCQNSSYSILHQRFHLKFLSSTVNEHYLLYCLSVGQESKELSKCQHLDSCREEECRIQSCGSIEIPQISSWHCRWTRHTSIHHREQRFIIRLQGYIQEYSMSSSILGRCGHQDLGQFCIWHSLLQLLYKDSFCRRILYSSDQSHS